MSENPEVTDKVSRYKVYRESEHGQFDFVGTVHAVGEKGALAVWMEDSDSHEEVRVGERFLIRQASIKADIRLYQVVIPRRTFDIVSA